MLAVAARVVVKGILTVRGVALPSEPLFLYPCIQSDLKLLAPLEKAIEK